MRYLDMGTWKRRRHFEFFSRMECPQFNVCADLNVGRFLPRVKAGGHSFYHAMCYAAARAANEVEEFRYRIRDGRVAVHEVVHPSFTVLDADEVFGFCRVDYVEDFDAFMEAAAAASGLALAETSLEDEPGRDDLLYLSCLPWVSFTSVSHPIQVSGCDSVPRITWGKYRDEGGRMLLPLSVQVHHGLMDGLHVGRYFQRLQGLLDSLEAR